jgi:molybdopterin synthase catalytic subunit
VHDPGNGADWLVVTEERLEAGKAIEWAIGPSFGGVAAFVGVVRDNAGERTEVSAIDYEAYESQVEPVFARLVSTARENWPELGRIALWHRTGRVEVEEASVVVVASAPHRDVCFAACQFLIDTLKKTAPIWKREHWPGGDAYSTDAWELAR